MFKIFFLSEIKSTIKQPMVYIFLSLIAALVFGATVSEQVTIGGSIGNVYKNSPYIITTYTGVFTLISLLIAAAFFNNAALRDYNNNFNEILFSTPLKKSGYFFGRFFGALIMATIPVLGVYLGIILGSFLAPIFGWEDASRFGDFFIKTFVNNYVLFILPNMFFTGAIIFQMANIWKSTVISFVGTLFILIAYGFSGTLMSNIDNETIAALVDPFGIQTFNIQTKYFTVIEKNTLSPQFSGVLLFNRIIWTLFGTVILFLSYFKFSFQTKNKKIKKVETVKSTDKITFNRPTLHPIFTSNTEWKQFSSFFKINFLSITKSITFKILFLFSAIMLFTSFIGGFEYLGLQSYPLTYKMIVSISSSTFIFVIIVLVFFSGELIWRDRESAINEVIDATPHTSLISLSAKALSLISIVTIMHFFFVFCGIIYQLFNGYTNIEFGVYLQSFIYSDLPSMIVWSALMILIHVLINNKYIGFFVAILSVFIWNIMLSVFDVSSKMVSIASRPSIMYSDMNKFGPGLEGALWFNLYWVLLAFISLIIAGALWNRGVVNSLRKRISISKKQVPKSYRLLIITSFFVWLLVASFVFYNTQVLNTYKSSSEYEEQRVEYEKTYKKYENVKLPKIIEAKYFIDIYPHKRDVYVKSILKYTNETDSPIDSIHYSIDKDWQPEIKIPNSKIILDDQNLGYRIYKLNTALQPHDTIEVEINTKYITKGFKNNRGNTSIMNNGTFFNNKDILPSLGYVSGAEINDKNTRKKYDLKPKERMPELEEHCGNHCLSNYLSNGHSDFINVETVISTANDQIAIAPGNLIKEWRKDGRNYYNYKVDHPSMNFYSFVSAKFEVKKHKWKDIDIEVYYDKKHSMNVDMMIKAVQRSLEYYTKNYGPYYHKQCRILEFPRYATFAQSFPGTMPYSESIGFVINLEKETGNNIVDAVISHEMAHQWWAHQVIGAKMQGSTLMSESFAEYSSLMTMKSISKNDIEMRKFLKYDHDRYLRGRSSEQVKELPLYKVENQMYIHYGKGSTIMYALQDYIGEDKVNTAMRNFLEEYKYKTPYPTSYDFLKYLEPEVPDSLKYLITDWFKEITLYDNRLKDAKYTKLENGKYQVTINTESYKIKADSIGKETKVLINDWIDIGVFSDKDEENLLYIKREKIDKTNMTFTFSVDSLPVKASIDPKHLLIDRIYNDNIKIFKRK